MTRILIVEDEIIVAEDLRLTLEQFGYQVIGTAATAAAAIALATEQCPDLALMDVRIRGDMDGIATAAILRERFDVPVVYLSAYADDATLARARATGPHGYLTKPFNDRELRAAIEMALYRHERERRLRQREHWLSTTLRSVGAPLVALDPEGRVAFMNAAAEGLTGWAQRDATGRGVDEVLARAGERAPGSPLVRQRAPIVDEGGQELGSVVVLRDPAEGVASEPQMMLADRLASLGTLAIGLAHEINNPLATVDGGVDVLAQGLDRLRALANDGAAAAVLAELGEVLGDVRAGATRIRDLLTDLRLFAAPDPRPTGPIDPLEPVRWALRLTRRQLEAGAELVLDLGALPPVVADEARLGQVFVDVLVNAAQAVADAPGRPHRISVTTRTDGQGDATIVVADTGVGIAPEVAPRIFEPFFTTRARGHGLGLAVCQGILRTCGGRIVADSAPGRGATFTITLPAARPQPVAAPAPAGSRRARVLVVDDDVPVARAVGRLVGPGLEVTIASDPREALALLAAGPRFDAVICDLMMAPLDGRQLYEAVRRDDPAQATRFIFTTGGAFAPAVQEFLAVVDNPRLEKPFDVAALRATVDAMVARAM